MKITFILPHISISGGVKSTFELANRLHYRGHRVALVYPLIPHRGETGRYELRKRARLGRKILGSLKAGNCVRWFDVDADLVRVKTLEEKNIPGADIVVATWWANAYDISRYSPDKGAKFYIIRHYEIWGGDEERVNGSYTLPLHRITTSTWLRNLIGEKFQVEVHGPLPNGIDTRMFYRERDGYGAHSPRRVGMLYRDLGWKGMKDGLEALSMVKREFPGVRVVLFGERPDRSYLRGLGDVELHHLPYGGELRRVYNSLDVFVFPSHAEGYGNPPMEAMACGAACVATGVGAVPDYSIPGKTALIVSPGEPAEIAEAVIALLRDEERRRSIARSGSEHIRQFTWESSSEKLEELFLRLSGLG